MTVNRLAIALLVPLLAAACGGDDPPPTRFYRVDPSVTAGGSTAGTMGEDRPVLVLRAVEVDDAYGDARIAYRRGPHELSYYHYHRWASPVAEQVADALQRGYESTARFERVLRSEHLEEGLALEVRVERFEEIDQSDDRWLGHLVLRLQLDDAVTGEVLWSGRESERVEMPSQDPAGLAAALSEALARVVRRTAGQLVAARPMPEPEVTAEEASAASR